jgi:hypothetical protein
MPSLPSLSIFQNHPMTTPNFHSQSQLHPVVPQTLRIPPAANGQCPGPESAKLGVMGQAGAGVRGLGGARTLEREERTIKDARIY